MPRERAPSPSLALVPDGADHDELVQAARGCTACDLYKRATQAVFGEGPTPAPLMLVGEQPGDQEDEQGRPFVGPAGRVLDAALEEAGIARDQVYLTNAVKHFKWEPRGKRRLHAKPNAVEIHACRGWLEAEIALVQPTVIVCLGATAAQAFLGRGFSVTKERGVLRDGAPWAPQLLATWHPSALLRMISDEDAYGRAKEELARDLATARAEVILPKGRTSRSAGTGATARRGARTAPRGSVRRAGAA